jgi:hypothetical protein
MNINQNHFPVYVYRFRLIKLCPFTDMKMRQLYLQINEQCHMDNGSFHSGIKMYVIARTTDAQFCKDHTTLTISWK